MIGKNKFKENIDEIVKNFGLENQDGIKESLRYTQDTFGHVSMENQNYIGEAFSVKDNVVKTIIKFMPSIKESDVKYDVVCCSGSRCGKKGSLEVLKSVKKVLKIDFGEYTEDGGIRLSTQNCFKKCNLGPNIKVNNKFYHNMNSSKVENLMNQLIEK